MKDRNRAEAARRDGRAFPSQGDERLQIRHGGLLSIIGVLLLLAAAIAVTLAVVDTNRHTAEIARANLVGQQMLRASSVLNEVEAAERGYVLTGDQRLHDTFTGAAAELRRMLDVLPSLVEDERQKALLGRVSTLADEQTGRASRIVGLVREGRNEDAIARLREETGADPMGPLKASVREFLAGADRVEAAARSAYDGAAERQFIAAMAAAFAIVVFGLHQVVNTYRFMRQLSASKANLRQANIGLEDQVATRTEELAETVMRFQVALRAADVVVFSQDAQRRFTWISRDIFGLPPERILGGREEELFPPEVVALVVAKKQAVLETGEARGYDYGAVIDGRQRWFRARAEPLLDDSGRTTGVIGAEIEVTGERQAQHRIAETTRELSATLRQLDVALRGADIFVFTQDPEMRFTFASHGFAGRPAGELIGMKDEDILDPDIAARIKAMKKRVLASGEPEVADLPMLPAADGGRRWLKLRLEKLAGAHGEEEGVIGCAVDVTREKRAEKRLRALTDELDRTVQRFQIALRGAEVVVFTQDRDLRFTWVSSDVRGMSAESMLGRTEEDLVPTELAPRMREFKQTALMTGEPQSGEFRHVLPEGERWFFIRVEAQRDEAGEVVGLLGAAVDVTERRQREVHNRVLLRELTHRTKNLLAVVQAMARQTLTASSSARDFEARFSGRLLGLARSLDVLVDENWEGASVSELVRSQLGHYRDAIGTRIVLDGPDLRLEPEAAQNIGLALHELSTNSARFGALSVDQGHVLVNWGLDSEKPGRFHFSWVERDGPPVDRPSRKGFGHAVLERLVPRGLSGTGSVEHQPEGLVWRLDVPALHVRGPDEAPRPIKVWAG